MKNLLCFETFRPCKEFFELCSQIKTENYDIYIFIDDNSYEINFEYDKNINVIKINNDECKNAGYYGFVSYFKERACSKDKALYYVVKNNIEDLYDYIWFIEEDCFIPSNRTIPEIDNKYEEGKFDLLCKSNELITSKKVPYWPHWKYVFQRCSLDPPYGRSLICVRRCSKKLIDSIRSYIEKYKKLFFCEAFFNIIALHNNLSIKAAEELSSIKWEPKYKWDIKIMKEKNIYHPIKDIKKQFEYRKKFMNNSLKSE
jgi:hypothetical protein